MSAQNTPAPAAFTPATEKVRDGTAAVKAAGKAAEIAATLKGADATVSLMGVDVSGRIGGLADAMLEAMRPGEAMSRAFTDADGRVGILAVIRPLTAEQATLKRGDAPTTGYLTLANVARKDVERRVPLAGDAAERAWPECPHVDVVLNVRTFDQSDAGKARRTELEVKAAVARRKGEIEREYEASIARMPFALRDASRAKVAPEMARQFRIAEDRIRVEHGLAPLYPQETHTPTPVVGATLDPAGDVDVAFVAVDPAFAPRTRAEVVADLRSQMDAGQISAVEATVKLRAWEREYAERG